MISVDPFTGRYVQDDFTAGARRGFGLRGVGLGQTSPASNRLLGVWMRSLWPDSNTSWDHLTSKTALIAGASTAPDFSWLTGMTRAQLEEFGRLSGHVSTGQKASAFTLQLRVAVRSMVGWLKADRIPQETLDRAQGLAYWGARGQFANLVEAMRAPSQEEAEDLSLIRWFATSESWPSVVYSRMLGSATVKFKEAWGWDPGWPGGDMTWGSVKLLMHSMKALLTAMDAYPWPQPQAQFRYFWFQHSKADAMAAMRRVPMNPLAARTMITLLMIERFNTIAKSVEDRLEEIAKSKRRASMIKMGATIAFGAMMSALAPVAMMNFLQAGQAVVGATQAIKSMRATADAVEDTDPAFAEEIRRVSSLVGDEQPAAGAGPDSFPGPGAGPAAAPLVAIQKTSVLPLVIGAAALGVVALFFKGR